MNGRSRHVMEVAGALALLVGSVSCGNVVRTGRSPSLLVIDSLTGASGATPTSFSSVLDSDVITIVTKQINGASVQVATIFDDPGQVQLHIDLKDAGTPTAPISPSALNSVTINRYEVVYTRADGLNTQGVDVPYTFDGAITATVTVSPSQIGFLLVRTQAKEEPPLVALSQGGGSKVISTIANVTFYGADQAGNAVSVTGSISINFADFGDPG
jgi:hypothetical protein